MGSLVLAGIGGNWAVITGAEACPKFARAITTEPIAFGRFEIYDGEPASSRWPCHGDDLWNYRANADLKDGVMFDDCTIYWTAGGRSTANDEGIPCSASPAEPEHPRVATA